MVSQPTPERWRPVDAVPGYEVSDLGRVRSLDRYEARGARMVRVRVGRLLRLATSDRGYRVVSLAGVPRKVHRLVAVAFLGPAPAGRPEVNHLDGNKRNNRATNLEWSDRPGNMLHAYARGLAVQKRAHRGG
jgi:hypothetical protein